MLAAAAALAAFGALAFVVSAYLVHPLALPALLAAAAFVAAAFVRPVYGLAGAVLMTPLDAFAFSLPVGALSPAEAALAVVALAWVSRAALDPHSVALPALRDAPFAVFVLVVAAGVLVAVDASPVLRVTLLWSAFYLVYLQAQGLSAREIRFVLIAAAVAAGILGAIGVVNYVQSGSPELFAGGAVTGERAVGSFADPNYYAALLAIASVPAIVLALANLKRDGWLLAPAALAITGIAFSLSRGAMLGVVVFSRGRQRMGIQLIEDLQLLPERCWRKDIRFGGISSATPHPDLLETLTGRERDVPMMGLVFEGTVGIDPGIGTQSFQPTD